MKKLAVALILILTVLAATPYLGAQGFKPFELGARAAGLGGAFAGRADDASAIYFNPAGLAFLPGLRLKIDISYNVLTKTAEIPGFVTAPRSKSPRFIGEPYVAFNVKDFLAIGIASFSANTMRTAWPSIANRSFSANESGFSTTYIRPVLALRILKSLALGVGVDFIRAGQNWDHDKIFTFEEAAIDPIRYFPARVKTNLEGRGTGFTAGWLFKPSARFGFGGKYTSRVEIELAGSTDVDNVYSGGWPTFPNLTPIRGVATKAKMAMPEEIVVGLMVAPLERLSFHLDFQKIGMSGALDWMFDVGTKLREEIERRTGYPPDETELGAGLVLKDTRRIMLGIEYVLWKALGVRAGYSRLESSVADVNLKSAFPDLATDVLSFGLGYEGPFFDLANQDKKLGGLSADAFFQYGLSQGRQSLYPDDPAFYKGNRWSVGVGVGFVF